MGKLAGLLMIAAGVGTAAYVYPMMGTDGDRADRQLADVVSITTGTVPVGQPVATRPPVVVVRPFGQDTQRVVSAETTPGKLSLGTQANPASKSSTIASVVAAPVVETHMAKPIDAPQPSAVKRTSRVDDEARMALTRDIQRELKRVGCYDGVVDGAWTPDTRQAMKLFVDRVNASLPVEEADHILKTMVQGHPGNACGKSCPTGQAMSADSKCIPTAIIAAPRRALQPTPVSREAAVQVPAAPAGKASSWEPKIVVAPVPVPVPVQKAQVAPEPRVAEVKVDRPDPIPGRTSLGANGVPAPLSAPSVTEAPVEPKVKRPVIVVKPRTPTAVSDDTPTASLPQSTSTPAPSTPTIGAIAAIEAPEKQRVRPSQPAAAYRSPPPVIYRAPLPPRYVTNYPPPPVYRERQRFGPQIFRDLERNGR